MVCGRLARVLNENTFAVRLVGIRSDLGAVSPKEGSLFDTPKGCLAWAGDAWPRIGVGPQYRWYRQHIGLGGGEGSMGKSLSRPATSRSHTTYAIMSSMNAKAATRRWLHPTPAWLVWGAVALCQTSGLLLSRAASPPARQMDLVGRKAKVWLVAHRVRR